MEEESGTLRPWLSRLIPPANVALGFFIGVLCGLLLAIIALFWINSNRERVMNPSAPTTASDQQASSTVNLNAPAPTLSPTRPEEPLIVGTATHSPEAQLPGVQLSHPSPFAIDQGAPADTLTQPLGQQFYLQAGAFTQEAGAIGRRNNIRALNLPAEIVIGDNGYFVVRSGPFTGSMQCERAQLLLQENKIETKIKCQSNP